MKWFQIFIGLNWLICPLHLPPLNFWKFRQFKTFLTQSYTCVVYFDQLLGAAHSKYWLKYALSRFFVQQIWQKEKSMKFYAKLSKKCVFLVCTRMLVGGFISKNSFYAQKCWKSIFWPAFGVCITQMLVKIYSTIVFSFDFFLIVEYLRYSISCHSLGCVSKWLKFEWQNVR